MMSLPSPSDSRATDLSPEDAPGTERLLHGTYRILEPLAAGGMAHVYLASHERLPGQFAIKVPARKDPVTVSRFHAEAQVLATLRHPNIVRVIDFNTAPGGTPYLVMEFVEGGHLRHHLASDGAFSPARVGHILGQLASALQLAHDNDIVHRDLKLENVMLTSTGDQVDVVKLLDFGIAQIGAAVEVTAEEELVWGTPQFMAPEQVDGDEIDDRADQFALACIAHTLLTGREPFRAESPIAVLYQVVHAEPEALEEHLGPSFRLAGRILRRAMAKNPEVRFATIVEFASTLQRALLSAESDTRLQTAA